MPELKRKLTDEELTLILNNCYSNIFVTDEKGKIVFANADAADALCVSEEYLLSSTIYDLLRDGVTDYSSTDNTLKTGQRTVASYNNKDGQEIMTVTTPVFDKDGNIILCVTYSRKTTDMDMFLEQIKEERKRTDRYREVINYIDESNRSSNVIIYKSAKMDSLCRTARAIAPSDGTVMLYGESGVGKEVMANYIHNHSNRKDEIFMALNCAAIPANLIESELFGYEKGAFTGASSSGKAGLFEVTNKGTIFLDEIGELPLDMQSKLLRVLENGEFMRIGSDKVRKTDVRVIGATNRNLLQMVGEHTFREDLYYRLNVLPLNVPSLRERTEDIEALASYYLGRYNRKYGKRLTLSEEQMNILKAYPWYGNVRELRNIIERYAVTSNNFVIDSLMNFVNEEAKEHHATQYTDQGVGIQPLKDKMQEIESRYIHQVLELCNDNVQKAADILGVHRSLIYRKLREEK
ncbi:MAG: sigma 54-interacting transcriptional regulator [Firmicutes bacterium]|nr:sigma 54-interacting transcriptional regulator [Bacillota bacterium]